MSQAWRNKVYRKPTRNLEDIDDPIVKELFNGNTVVVEGLRSLGDKKHPYKNLYYRLALRGYRLQMHTFDDVDSDIFRGLIMWAEPMVVLWNCSRCGNFEVGTYETKPQNRNCESKLRYHSWRRVQKMISHRKKIRADEEIAA